MKLSVVKDTFAKSLNLASRFASHRAQLPILSNFKLEAKGSKLTITATNLEMSISLAIGAQVEEEGQIAVPAKTLNELISSIKSQNVSLETKEEILIIKTEKSKSRLMCINASEFPEVSNKLAGEKFEISTSNLNLGLSKTLFSVSVDESRPILTGVLMVLKKTAIRFVSTDGFRLSLLDTKLDRGESSLKFILPKNILIELIKIIEGTETVSFAFDKETNQVIFQIEDIIVSSRIIQGDFPDYEKIIPAEFTTKILSDKEELMEILKLSSIFARESANVVKMAITDSSLSFNSESQTSGAGESKMEIKKEGENIEIAYNCKFLEDFLNSVKGENIEIDLNDPNSPGLFKDPSLPTLLHIIMPVKI